MNTTITRVMLPRARGLRLVTFAVVSAFVTGLIGGYYIHRVTYPSTNAAFEFVPELQGGGLLTSTVNDTDNVYRGPRCWGNTALSHLFENGTKLVGRWVRETFPASAPTLRAVSSWCNNLLARHEKVNAVLSDIVGKWEVRTQNGYEVLQFFNGGVATSKSEKSQSVDTWSYSILDDQHLKLENQGLFYEVKVLEAIITNDVLTLSQGPQIIGKYRRIK